MVRLNTDRINETSPYQVKGTDKPGVLEFYTDHGVHYLVDFILDDLIMSSTVYQFGIANINNVPSPRDEKVRETIITIIQNFFEENVKALLYICETGDGKQSMRNRLFRSWFEKSGIREEIALLSASIPDEEGIMNYATLMVPILSNDFEAVTKEFREIVSMFKSK